MKTIKILTALLVLVLYSLVIIVALLEGPLVSYQSILLGIIGLAITLLIISDLARKVNMVDVADEPRREHKGRIPLVGGIGLFISMVYGASVFGIDRFYFYLLASMTPILIAGLIDGIHGIHVRPVYRIIAQILASWMMILITDIYVRDLGDILGIGSLYIGQMGIPFTIFAVVGVCNAFNMIDGKDGLLGSTVLIILTSLLILLYLNGVYYFWGQILIFSILVYLAFNLSFFGRKRKIFLGDHGSTGLGFVVAWSLIFLSQVTETITPVSALWFILLPLNDALLTFLRRYRSSSSIFKADRQHFHHKLSDLGLSDKKILILFCLISIFSSSIAVVSILFEIDEAITFFAYITFLIFCALLVSEKPMKKID